MPGTCIYCKQDSSSAQGVPHVFPEAFAQNRLVLPVGSVCDGCNNYLGVELDSVFVAHPILSALAQFLRFPGKSGKLRRQLGNVELDARFPDQGRATDQPLPRTITVPCAKPRIVTHPDGSRTATIEPLIDPRFDFRRFRRAIHHIALNAFALKRGDSAALEPRFDSVRDYIRKPKPKEVWPFAQYVNLNVGFTHDVTILIDAEEDHAFVGMVICAGMAFGVDLLNRGNLRQWMEQQFPPSTEIIGVNHHVPRAQRPSKKAPMYCVTIYLDE